MNRLVSLLALSSVLFFAVVGCSEKNNPPPPVEVIPVKGNPMVFVEGTDMDTSQGLPELMALDSEQKWMVHTRVFMEDKQREMDESIKGQQPITADGAEKIKDSVETAKFTKEDNGSDYGITFFQGKIKIIFASFGDQLFVKNFAFKGEPLGPGNDLKVLHYSVKGSRAFNILAYLRDNGHRYLMSVTYVKQKDVSILEQTLNTAYNYLYGSGVSTKWSQDKPLEIHVCKTFHGKFDELTENSIRSWQEPLAERLIIKVEQKATCPPFSDLNSVTVRHITGWIEILGAGAAAAFNINAPDFYQGEFIDSDIMFLVDEWNEGLRIKDPKADIYDERYSNNGKLQESYKQTIVHEAGHLLGLGHIFDGTKSIMSYDQKVTSNLFDYDKKSIQELYPQLPKPAEPEEEPEPVSDPTLLPPTEIRYAE